jgi:hypothetical protein
MSGQQPSSDQFTERSLAVWRGLLRVHAHVVAAQNADLQDKLGLSVTEWEVLHALATAPDGQRRVRDVAGIVLLTSGGVTRLVNRLEGRGLVERVSCPDDRRGTSIAITRPEATPTGARGPPTCSGAVPGQAVRGPAAATRRRLGNRAARRRHPRRPDVVPQARRLTLPPPECGAPRRRRTGRWDALPLNRSSLRPSAAYVTAAQCRRSRDFGTHGTLARRVV